MRRVLRAAPWLQLGPRLVGLVILGTFLAGGLVSSVLSEQSRRVMRENILTHKLALADVAGELTTEYVGSPILAMQDLSQRPSIVQAVLAGTPEQIQPELQVFCALHPRASGPSRVDPTGTTWGGG
jgi:hypothetical protein